ncbi:MAG TPA: pyridoxal-phosphate dependent enzyme [Acidimicrobiales bacterium]|nr:pyridoxal-phosphate dependent enzyme [Acidimicrobiales bacterium]
MDLTEVAAAAARLEGVVRRTPVLTSSTLDELIGSSLHLKCENFQRTGTFKFRGAYNAIASLPENERARGVCTVSSGNHAQAVALSAQLHGVPAVVMMPHDAPKLKLAAARGYGAEVRIYDRNSLPQYLAGERVTEETGLTFVSSHDHPSIVAGAGTAALELFEDAGPLDLLFAPVGGGGGLAGYAVVAKAQPNPPRVIGVEPASSGLAAASMAAGELVERPVPTTIADGQRLTVLGDLNFAIMRESVDRVVGVTEEEIVEAMRFAFERLKIVLEPSGACSLAAVLSNKVEVAGQAVGVVLSGGNIGTDRFIDLLR